MDNKLFKDKLESDKLIVVDFSATWCGPCQMMRPIVEEIKAEYKDSEKVEIVEVDIDENPVIPASYSVMSVPTFLFIKNKEVLDKVVGSASREILTDKIEKWSGEEKK